MRQSSPVPIGYLAAVISSTAGAFLMGRLGFWLAGQYLERFMPNATLEGVYPPLVGVILGICVGATMGSWLILRCQSQNAGSIARRQGLLVLVGTLVVPLCLMMLGVFHALFLPAEGIVIVLSLWLARRWERRVRHAR